VIEMGEEAHKDKPRAEVTNSDGSIELVDIETQEDYDRMDGLELLDDLIRTFHSQVRKKLDKHFKTGDFIRMIELRYKLSPTNDEQKKFWAMLAKIRRDTLQKEENGKKGELQKAGRNTPK